MIHIRYIILCLVGTLFASCKSTEEYTMLERMYLLAHNKEVGALHGKDVLFEWNYTIPIANGEGRTDWKYSEDEIDISMINGGWKLNPIARTANLLRTLEELSLTPEDDFDVSFYVNAQDASFLLGDTDKNYVVIHLTTNVVVTDGTKQRRYQYPHNHDQKGNQLDHIKIVSKRERSYVYVNGKLDGATLRIDPKWFYIKASSTILMTDLHISIRRIKR